MEHIGHDSAVSTGLTYTVDVDRRLVIISGDYASASDWLTLAARLLRDRRVHAGFAFLRDVRGATQPHNVDTVLAIFSVVQRFWPSFKPAKGALLTDRDDDTSAQVAQALADSSHLPIRIFTSWDAAIEWLQED